MAIRRMALGCTILALAGCGAASPRMVTATDTEVSYSWDTDAATVADITSLAKSYCKKRDRQASLVANNAASKTGTFFVTQFNCVPPEKAQGSD
jgi:hypothetical protein